jgi:hypothetical protein
MNLMLIAIIAAIVGFAIYQYRKYDGKPFTYFLGSMFLLFGALFIEPSPDFISFSIYALLHHTTYAALINPAVLPSVLWDFEIWSTILGIIMVLIGMYLLKWSWKKLWKKIYPGHYSAALMIAFGAVLAVAVLDIFSAKSGLFGSLIQYTTGNVSAEWWKLFFKFAVVIFAIPAICYYFFVHRDKSEAVGIFGFSTILYFGGLADIFYFVLQKIPVPSELPHLIGSPFVNFVSTKLLGYSTVTNVGLLVSTFLSLLIALGFAKVLKEYM